MIHEFQHTEDTNKAAEWIYYHIFRDEAAARKSRFLNQNEPLGTLSVKNLNALLYEYVREIQSGIKK